ncbi:MAG: glycerophosphodiester phosphodiesterase family protein [Terrisporobacter sp.]|uniref:glycerophosphodiester phosphodiesterase family protein n=1 Tax=Terrisporobacter sp. TaxID=1965305 RepID=UPI002FC78ED5
MNIFAHRGLSAYYPENTMLAFSKCLDLNIYGIEFDVQKSKDNQLVIIHDEKVDRTYKASGYVKNFTLKELQSLDPVMKGYENREDCKIPTLEEVLTLFKPTDFVINIELKNSKVKYKNLEKDVIKLIKKFKMEKRVILSSFCLKSIIKCNKINSKIETSYLVDKLTYTLRLKTKIFSKIKRYNCSAIHPSFELINKDFVKKAHRKNLKINSYTVDDLEIFQELTNLKVDGIFTNYPNIFPSILD